MTESALKKLSRKPVDQILALLNVLKIVGDVSRFEKWLKEYHGIEFDKTLLEGYKFFLITALRVFVNTIELDTSLGLSEDYTFFRARFKGKSIEEIPNTCEKTIFIKNLWNLTRPLRKAKNLNQLRKSLSCLKILFEIFNQLYKISTPTKNIEKSWALNTITQFYTYLFFNDTHRGIPHGYILPSTLKSSGSIWYLTKVFEGYVFSLQYLWFKLLGKEDFERSCLKDLHKAPIIYSKEAEDYINLELGILPEEWGEEDRSKGKHRREIVDIEIEVEPISKKELKKLEKEREKLLKLKNWFALDVFFGKIQYEIIKPLEKSLKINLTFEPLLVIRKVDKKIFYILLSRKCIQEPRYLKKGRKKEDIKKWLDFKLLWYNVEVLSSAGSIFSGVPAFIAVLSGLVNLSEEKTLVKIFKHPVKGIKGFDYSYGILIPAFGTSGLTDFSGWLIFFDCATDYSGFGGSLYTWAKIFIEKFKEEGRIEVEEIIVDKTLFQEYIKERSESSVFDRLIIQSPFGPVQLLDISKIEEDKNRLREEIKGLLFELIVYKWIVENYSFEKIYHDRNVGDQQIDIFYIKDTTIYLFECTISVHNEREAKEKMKQIRNQLKAIKSKYQKYSIVPIIVTYSSIQDEIKRYFEKNGIKIEEDFRKKIKGSRMFSKTIKNIILRILEGKR